MKIRSKLILAFFLMSVLPLSGIVGYSYFTSLAAFENAVEEEAEQMTEQMSRRLASLRGGLRDQLSGLGDVPFGSAGPGMSAPGSFRRMLESSLGDSMEFVEGLEWSLQELEPGVAPEAGSNLEPAVAGEGFEIQLGDGREMTIVVPTPPAPPVAGTFRAGPPGQGRDRLERAALGFERNLEVLRQRLEREAERVKADDLHGAIDSALEVQKLEAEISRLEVRNRAMKHVLAEDFSTPIIEDGEIVGTVRASVRLADMLKRALSASGRRQGEVPFAVDANGEFYTPDSEFSDELEEIKQGILQSVGSPGAAASGRSTRTIGDWIVVTQSDPDSPVTFGIARPVKESLAEMRSVAARNLAIGLGMISLALFGILPMSGRMSRRLQDLSVAAGELASGNLEARATVTSGDEIGDLARTFNDMASDLVAHRDRLVEQELTQRLLENDNQRKSQELEEARQFQLSLLPGQPPTVPGLEVRLFTRTAAEVGGDYYDYLVADDGSLTLAIGDATGHGAMAGTMVAVVKGLFVESRTGRGGLGCGLNEFLSGATCTIKRMQLGRMQMALALARISAARPGESRTVTVASAGMPPSLVHRAATGQVEEIDLPGLPLGAREQVEYPVREFELHPGDCMISMSDGLPELVRSGVDRAHIETFGYDRLGRLVESLEGCGPDELIGKIGRTIDEWREGGRPNDDVTLAIMRVV